MSLPSATDPKPDLLFLAHRIPYPPNKGDKIRSYNELAFLSRHFSIHLICPFDQREDEKHTGALMRYCTKVEAAYLSKPRQVFRLAWAFATGKSLSVSLFKLGSLAHAVSRFLASHPSAPILVFSGQMADYLPTSALPRTVVDFCDVDSHKWLHYADSMSGWKRWLYQTEAKRLAAFEHRIAAECKRALFITDAECSLFREHGGPDNIESMPNGVDTDFFKPEPGRVIPGRLLFTGAMDYYPNVEGVEWFVKSVMPLLRGKVPGLRFVIAGSNPAPAVKALACDDVEVTGFVQDMRTEQAKAQVVVVPLRIARGMQNKVLEALACGKPVVSTSRSLGGIEARHFTELCIADQPAEFAESVLSLCLSTEKSERMGQVGREFVLSRFSWTSQLERKLLPLLH